MMSTITPPRVIAAAYLVFVGSVAGYLYCNGPKDSLHHQASRDLAQGTRIAEDMMGLPEPYGDFHDMVRLRQERRQIIGFYLKEPVKAGKAITPDDVEPWPDLQGVDVVAVALSGDVNWRLYNSGGRVHVGEPDAAEQVARIAAIVPVEGDGAAPAEADSAKAKWLVLLHAVADNGARLRTTAKTVILSVEAPPQKRASYTGGG